MKLTTPYAVLAGFALVALAIASQPLTGSLVPEAWAQSDKPVKVVICDVYGGKCHSPHLPMEVTVCNPLGNRCAWVTSPKKAGIAPALVVNDWSDR